MGTEDRLKYDGTPRLKLPDDIGDYPIPELLPISWTGSGVN